MYIKVSIDSEAGGYALETNLNHPQSPFISLFYLDLRVQEAREAI